MFLPHRQAGQPALRLAGLPAYGAKTPWKILIRDTDGGPAVAEASFGKGRILIMQPSFEQMLPGTGNSPATNQGWELFENVMDYVSR